MTYTSETIGTLRNTKLLDRGHLDGATFVRCIPHRVAEKDRMAHCLRVVADCGEPDLVMVAYNPDFGGDYVRVDVTSKAFQAICQWKS